MSADYVSFFVPGDPITKGSGRAVAKGVYLPGSSKVGGRKIKAFTALVKWHAIAAMRGRALPPPDAPIGVRLVFRIAKPKSNKDPAPVRRNDLDKLCRLVFDALSGVCYGDDSRVIWLETGKFWATDEIPSGVWIGVGRTTMHEEPTRA